MKQHPTNPTKQKPLLIVTAVTTLKKHTKHGISPNGYYFLTNNSSR